MFNFSKNNNDSIGQLKYNKVINNIKQMFN